MADETQTTPTETTTSTEGQPPEAGSSSSTTDQQARVDLAGDADDQAQAQTTDTQTDTRTDEERAADEAREKLFGAPEGDASYEIAGLPEGMEIDKEALDAVAPVFRELNLSNEGASRVAQVYAEKVLPAVMERATNAIEQQVVAQRSEWERDAEAAIKANGHELKNAAGETLSFDAKDKDHVMKTAAKALDRLAPVGFREFLKETGLSVHPAMVAFAYQAGKAIAEDTEIEAATSGANKPKSRVEKYYS